MTDYKSAVATLTCDVNVLRDRLDSVAVAPSQLPPNCADAIHMTHMSLGDDVARSYHQIPYSAVLNDESRKQSHLTKDGEILHTFADENDCQMVEKKNDISHNNINIHSNSPFPSNQAYASLVDSLVEVEEPTVINFPESNKSPEPLESEIVEENTSVIALIDGGTIDHNIKNSVDSEEDHMNIRTDECVVTSASETPSADEYEDDEFDDRYEAMSETNVTELANEETIIRTTDPTDATSTDLSLVITKANSIVRPAEEVIVVDEEEIEEVIEEVIEVEVNETSESEDSRYNLNSSSDSISSKSASSLASSTADDDDKQNIDIDDDAADGPETDSEALYKPTDLFSRRNSAAADDACAAITQVEDAKHEFSKGLSAR